MCVAQFYFFFLVVFLIYTSESMLSHGNGLLYQIEIQYVLRAINPETVSAVSCYCYKIGVFACFMFL